MKEMLAAQGARTIVENCASIKKGEKVLIVDDLIATGGTIAAAAQLVEKLGGEIVECAFLVDLPDLKGKDKLIEQGCKVFSLVEFEGE